MNTTPDQTANAAEIRNLIDAWLQGVRNKDIATIMAHHTPDMIAFDVPEPFQFTSAGEYARHWEKCMEYCVGEQVFEMSEQKITAGDDVAFATGVFRCAGTGKDGQPFECRSRATLGFQKIDGQWNFTHEHHSMPMAMPAEGAESCQ